MSALRRLGGLTSILLFFPAYVLGGTPTVLPTGLTFGYVPAGTSSAVQTASVYNLTAGSITVETVSCNNSVFTVVSGTTPVTIPAGQSANFGVQFTPAAPGPYNGILTVTFAKSVPETANLSGNGSNVTATPTLSTTSINFGTQPLGATVPTQSLTITNTGTSTVKLSGVTVTYPFWQTGWKSTKPIQAGKSLTLQIGYTPTLIAQQMGTIQLTYDVAPGNGVALWGSGESATALGIDTFSGLPGGTENSAYEAVLNAAGGTPPYTWSLVSGSSLPSGLSLSSSGEITGTLASTVGLGSYSFSLQVNDSAVPPNTASGAFTLAVGGSDSGKNCNTISFDDADGNLLIPITDLGTGYYLGIEQGGLYAGGSNTDDPTHDSYGQGLAAGIQPLNASGSPSPTGVYVLVSIGESVTQQAWQELVGIANADPSKNASLVVVDMGTGGGTAKELSTLGNNFWEVMTNNYLPNAGVTANQVVAAWVDDVDGGPTGTFPTDMTNLQSQYESIANNLLTTFPNIQIAYFSSMTYTGYSNGYQTLFPEPYAYESGFAVKNAIQDQINGNTNLNFNPTLGPVVAPWMAWGGYLWTNGMIPRSDGFVWTCQDTDVDGTHPSNPTGRIAFATQVLNFLKSDDTATPWFLAPGAAPTRSKN